MSTQPSRVTPTVQRLLDDAMTAGYVCEVVHMGANSIVLDLVQYTKHRTNPKVKMGVRLFLSFPRGAFHQAHRIDVPLDLTVTIRTVKQVRSILGLPV